MKCRKEDQIALILLLSNVPTLYTGIVNLEAPNTIKKRFTVASYFIIQQFVVYLSNFSVTSETSQED